MAKEHDESLMTVLSRLSYSIEEAMRQKRLTDERLFEMTRQVKVLTQANDALMKHVAGLEKRNEVVVNGIMRIVGTVDRNCRKIREDVDVDIDDDALLDDGLLISQGAPQDGRGDSDPSEEIERDSYTPKKISTAATSSSTATQTATPAKTTTPSQDASKFILDKEPESAELRSLPDHPIDPLMYSHIMDYSAEPDLMPLRRSTGLSRGSGLVWKRSGRNGSGNVRRRTRSGRVGGDVSGSVADENGVPGVPRVKTGCGCFFQSLFGCRK